MDVELARKIITIFEEHLVINQPDAREAMVFHPQNYRNKFILSKEEFQIIQWGLVKHHTNIYGSTFLTGLEPTKKLYFTAKVVEAQYNLKHCGDE